jgi:hypothetical protein
MALSNEQSQGILQVVLRFGSPLLQRLPELAPAVAEMTCP